MSDWKIVYDETNDEMFAPADIELLLGWWETWPEMKWRQEVGEYRNTRGHWCHGQATHFQPLPSPPMTSPEPRKPMSDDIKTCPWEDPEY